MRNFISGILALLLAFSPISLCASDEDSDLLRFSLEEASFEEALEELSRQSGVEILAQGIRPEARINLDLTDLTLDQALKEVVKVFGVENYARYTRAGAVNIWVLRAGTPPAISSVAIPEDSQMFQTSLTSEQLSMFEDDPADRPFPLTVAQLQQLEPEDKLESSRPLTPEQMQKLDSEDSYSPPLTEEQMSMLQQQDDSQVFDRGSGPLTSEQLQLLDPDGVEQ